MTSTRRSGSMRPRSTSSSVLGSSSTVRPGRSLVPIAIVLLVSLAWGASAGAAEYKGPLIDAHSHLPNARAIDAYVEAMKRHNVVKVVLLGVGGVQKDDPAWIAAAARKYPDRVVAALPLPDPTDDGDRKSTRLNSSHGYISYAVFCLKKKTNSIHDTDTPSSCHAVTTTR